MDVASLIQSVERYVFLYDTSHTDYKNTVLKNEVWEHIAQELRMPCDDVRYKWKTVRDCYIKFKRQKKKAGKTGKKCADYVWAPYLKFIDAFPTGRKMNSRQSPYVTQKPNQTGPSTNNSRLPPMTPKGGFEPQNTLVPEHSSVKLPQTNHADPANTNAPQWHDGTDYLFLSYAQTFKKFSLRQQVQLKMELAKLFSNAELNELDCSNNVESAATFAYMPVTDDVANDSSREYSSASSVVSTNDNVTIKQENDLNPFPE